MVLLARFCQESTGRPTPKFRGVIPKSAMIFDHVICSTHIFADKAYFKTKIRTMVEIEAKVSPGTSKRPQKCTAILHVKSVQLVNQLLENCL